MKPWLAHYDADVPPSLVPYPDRTLVDYLTALARDHGDKAALLFKGSSVSYGELDAAEHGVRGRAVGASVFARATASRCCFPTARSSSRGSSASWKVGAVVVAVNPTYRSARSSGMLDCDACEDDRRR